ncbi:glutathione S-transferase family protein [Qipengyuania sediminis]|uniref:glutathione S-transferase family protein n=1 Tax=Qipengyuania sediminis TaxID=1532023 RepID=UPI00308407E3
MLTLHGHPFSSYTWKALIPLYANRTHFTFQAIDPAVPKFESFTGRAHPAGQFPVLVDGETIVVEASAIVEYLAVHHPGPAPLIPVDPAAAAEARMLDRVLDNYVMGNMQRVMAAYFVDRDDPGGGGLRDEPDAGEMAAARAMLRRAYAWLENWLGSGTLPPHVSLVTCAAAPSLFYADWVEPIPPGCPRLQALRAELLALPAVARCVNEARPYRPFFLPGAPDRD